MKKLSIIIYFIILSLCGIYIFQSKETIINYVVHKYSTYNIEETKNEYTKEINYMSFKRTDDFTPENLEELVNVLYTVLDDGMDKFTFYCDYNCSDDIKDITNNDIMETINNYVHPYNSYSSFHISVNNYNVVNVSAIKTYTEYEIQLINQKIKSIADTIDGTTYEKILAFHNYIINNTKYDESSIDNQNSKDTSKAYSVLYKNLGICGGYTDTLAIYLNYIGIDNFKISSKDHIWNALYVDGKWYNIDMTWDDPVTNTSEDILIHDYFMISKHELQTKDKLKHNYNIALYQELN